MKSSGTSIIALFLLDTATIHVGLYFYMPLTEPPPPSYVCEMLKFV